MPITNCPKCGKCYEETSEETANSPSRECTDCWAAARAEENAFYERAYQDAITGADQRATAKLIEGLKRSQ